MDLQPLMHSDGTFQECDEGHTCDAKGQRRKLRGRSVCKGPLPQRALTAVLRCPCSEQVCACSSSRLVNLGRHFNPTVICPRPLGLLVLQELY